jgi:hypothetical protein
MTRTLRETALALVMIWGIVTECAAVTFSITNPIDGTDIKKNENVNANGTSSAGGSAYRVDVRENNLTLMNNNSGLTSPVAPSYMWSITVEPPDPAPYNGLWKVGNRAWVEVYDTSVPNGGVLRDVHEIDITE